MNIKSLLLGSAAALVVVSGARAADAVVVAEPEPVEYVRVCDVYGAGFFYIPGTETCLAISGYVWYQIAAENWEVAGDTYSYHLGARAADGWAKTARARVNFDARSETEWGTLRGYIRFQSTWNGYNTVDGPVTVDQAYIQLGGLMMGYTESAWAATQYGGATNWGSHSWSGLSYGYQQRDLIAYSFQGGNGFVGTISLEEDEGGNYVPDIVAKVGVNQGWGSAWVKAAYDESDASWAASAGVQVNVPNMPGSSLRVIGFYTNSATNIYGSYYDAGLPVPATQAANWSILASYNHQFNAQLGASVGYQYFDAFGGAANGHLVELSVVYTPVTNFEIRGEVGYAKSNGLDGTLSGYLRFTRYF